MFHNAITLCRTLLLAGAVGVLTAGAAKAAPHGEGFHPGVHSGFRDPGFRGSHHFNPNFRTFFVYPYFGSAYGSPYYGYPYSGYGYSYPSYAYEGGYNTPSDVPDQSSRSNDSQGGSALGRLPTDYTAHVHVKVPADAQLWFGEKKTKATGPVREFVTPKLDPTHWYSYEVRARWREKGREVTQTRKAVVTAGSAVEVDFTAAAPAPAPKTR
jgi:uncharacterized protein (TIGR03000 family)